MTKEEIIKLVETLKNEQKQLNDKLKANGDIRLEVDAGKFNEMDSITKTIEKIESIVTNKDVSLVDINSEETSKKIVEMVKTNDELKKQVIGEEYVEAKELENISLKKVNELTKSIFQSFDDFSNTWKTLEETKKVQEETQFNNTFNNILKITNLEMTNDLESVTEEEKTIIKEIIKRNLNSPVAYVTIKEEKEDGTKVETKEVNPIISELIKQEFLSSTAVSDRFKVKKIVKQIKAEEEKEASKFKETKVNLGENLLLTFPSLLKKITNDINLDTEEKKLIKATSIIGELIENPERSDLKSELMRTRMENGIKASKEDIYNEMGKALLKNETSIVIKEEIVEEKEEETSK